MLTNPRDAFRGRLRSPNIVPFDMLGMVSYSNFVPKTHRFWDIRLRKISWPWNPGQRSLKIVGTDTDRSATYDVLLTLHSNQGPISYRFRETAISESKIAKISHPVYFAPLLTGFALELGIGAWGKKTRLKGYWAVLGRTRNLTISVGL